MNFIAAGLAIIGSALGSSLHGNSKVVSKNIGINGYVNQKWLVSYVQQ